MFAWWNSLETVTTLSTVARWLIALMGVTVIILGARQSALQKYADEKKRNEMDIQIKEARKRAEESLGKLKPRSITPEQRITFLAAIKNAPKGAITVIPLMGNSESSEYGNELAGLLKEAGYSVQLGGMMPMDAVPKGVGLTVKPGESYPLHTNALKQAFDVAGIPVGMGYNGLQKEKILGLVVGVKP